MNKDELKRYISSRISTLEEDYEDYDRDTLIENAAGGGNHDDTFQIGESYGWNQGQIRELESILRILEETPDVEFLTN